MKRKEESVYKRFIDQKGGRLDGASTPRNGARAGGGVSIRFDCRKMVMRSGLYSRKDVSISMLRAVRMRNEATRREQTEFS